MYAGVHSDVCPTRARQWLLGFILAVGWFLISAPPVQAGLLDLAWDAPTTNADGTPLTDLGHYRVYVGTAGAPCPGGTYHQVPSPTPAPTVGEAVTTTVTGLVAGTTYVAQVTAVDASGNESLCSDQASGAAKDDAPDTTAPTSTLTINGGAAYAKWTAATLSLTATDAVGVTAYYVSTSATPPAAGAAGWVAVTATTNLASNASYTLPSGDGLKTVYAWYKDAAGNVSGTASDTITLDQTAPSGGTLNATAGNAQVTLGWAGFADGGSGLASSGRYKLVFGTSGTPNASCTNGTQLLLGTATSYTHTGRTNGTTYYYRVCASDTAGNMSTGATASATPQLIDTTAPAVSITSPTSNPTYGTTYTPLSLGGTASDTVGVTQVTWANDRGGSGTATGTTSWTVSGIVLQSGANVLTVTARDAAGNTAIDTCTVTYTPPDTTPPMVTITSPTSNPTYDTSSNTIALGGTASDNLAVTQVTWANDRGGSGTATGTTSWTASAITLRGGTNILTVTGQDAVGNKGSKTLTAKRHPKSKITAGPTGTITTDSASFAWSDSYSDVQPGSLTYAYRLDPVESSYSAFGPTTAKTYTNLAKGNYTFSVKARDQEGNEDLTPVSQSFTVAAPLAVTNLTANKAAPQPAGTPITLTASGTGGSGSYESRWYLWDGATWVYLRGWQAGLSYTWTPPGGNANYAIVVHVRNAGGTWDSSSQRSLAFPTTGSASAIPSVTNLTANKAAPQPAGTPITLTASGTGGSGSYESRWYLWDGATWVYLRGWQAGLSYTWTPPGGNANYAIVVHVRNAGGTWDSSSQRSLAFPTTGP